MSVGTLQRWQNPRHDHVNDRRHASGYPRHARVKLEASNPPQSIRPQKMVPDFGDHAFILRHRPPHGKSPRALRASVRAFRPPRPLRPLRFNPKTRHPSLVTRHCGGGFPCRLWGILGIPNTRPYQSGNHGRKSPCMREAFCIGHARTATPTTPGNSNAVGTWAH